MKLALWKRTMLAALMALSVVGGSLATFSAEHAAAQEICVRSKAGLNVCFEP